MTDDVLVPAPPIEPADAPPIVPADAPPPRHWIEVRNDGRIMTYGLLPADADPIALHGGTMVEVDVAVDVETTMFVAGELIPIDPSPGPAFQFDYGLREWIDTRSLTWWKAQKWDEIKAKRDETEFGPFVYNGMMFDGDRDAQRRLSVCSGLARQAIAAGGDLSIAYVLMDNTTVVLAAADFVAIELTKVQQVLGAFAVAMQLREAIGAAVSVAQVQAIAWPETTTSARLGVVSKSNRSARGK